MIRSFRHRGLKRLYELDDKSGIRPDILSKVENILAVLDRAGGPGPGHMNLPGFRPHPLKGDLHGLWAVTVRANWRIVWRFDGPDALDVDLVDYHQEIAMPMKNPPHPGRIVLEECIHPLGLSVSAAAKALGVSRNAVSELVNGRRGISPEMAIRLSKAFGSSPETWAGLQLDYDMARAMEDADRIEVQRVPMPDAA